jgi:hypothetical protein
MPLMLMQCDGTVCTCHRDLGEFTILAEVLVVAAGRRLVPTGLLILSRVAQPQATFPENPVKMIVPSPAATPPQLWRARLCSRSSQRQWGSRSSLMTGQRPQDRAAPTLAKATSDAYTLPFGPAHPLSIGLSPACLTTSPGKTSAGRRHPHARDKGPVAAA